MIAALLSLALAAQAPGPAPAATSQPSLDVGALVDKVIAAYGGPRAIQKLAAYRIQGRLIGEEADRPVAHGPGHDHGHARAPAAVDPSRVAERRIVRDVVAPGQMRVEVQHATRTERRLLDGGRGWRQSGERSQALRGLHAQTLQAQFLRAMAPWVLSQHRRALTDEGRRERDGKAHQVLRYQQGDLRVDFWVALDTYRVTRVESMQGQGAMQLHFATEYSDFRSVAGALVPHVERHYVRGNQAGTTQVERVRFGARGLGPFAPPGPSSAPAAN